MKKMEEMDHIEKKKNEKPDEPQNKMKTGSKFRDLNSNLVKEAADEADDHFIIKKNKNL